MNIPTEYDQEINLTRVLPILRETLSFCMAEACERNQIGYDSSTDEVTYRYKPNSLDTDLFVMLNGVEEIWVITKAGTES